VVLIGAAGWAAVTSIFSFPEATRLTSSRSSILRVCARVALDDVEHAGPGGASLNDAAKQIHLDRDLSL
jgi:hypothetical protein